MLINSKFGVFMCKFFIDELPKPFDDFFTKRSDIHNYHTRIRVITTKPGTKKYLLIKQFEQRYQLCAMLLMLISKT